MKRINDVHLQTYIPPTTYKMEGKWIYNWFSNMLDIGDPVHYRGRTTRILECAFQSAKNPDYPLGEKRTPLIDILMKDRTDGRTAKRIGSPKSGMIELRPNWEYMNVAAMDYFLRQRWSSTSLLMAHCPDERSIDDLVEWNNWGDRRWGVPISTGTGRNVLGRLIKMIWLDRVSGSDDWGEPDEERWIERQDLLVSRINAMT